MGCDFDTEVQEWRCYKFQSTHPHGVRPDDGIQGESTLWFQSTHPHGVRRTRNRIHQRGSCFNPRTRMGCDALKSGVSSNERKFQSTHPHGVRHYLTLSLLLSICFNPRTRMGCDTPALVRFSILRVSIHAPAWGATDSSPMHVYYYQFQSTHPHGVRHSRGEAARYRGGVSIHAPAWGATSPSTTPIG